MSETIHGICSLSVIPVRKDKSHESELVTELLFNEIYEIVDITKEWLKIRINDDGYEGWIRRLQHKSITDEEYNVLKSSAIHIIKEPISKYKGLTLSFGTVINEETEDTETISDVFCPDILITNARKLLNTPYRWGGKTVFGMDCSGFTQLCAKTAGYMLPRDASQQIKHGNLIYFAQESQPGDLAFFENEDHNIVHTGILLSNNEIIHSSGKIRIDFFDQTGIFNRETGKYSHFLTAIKRLH